MFNQWIERIQSAKQSLGASGDDSQEMQDNVERVSAALLVEIARADHQLEPAEVSSITDALHNASSLDKSEIDDIVNTAVFNAESAISLHEHIKLINEQFDQEQKYLLIEQMWRVAVADGNIDQYEDYTIRKLSDLMYVKHSEFIKAKLRVIDR